MHKWIPPLLLIFGLLVPIRAHAQDPLSLSSMFIQIWPEYDKPSVLVIYQITLDSSTPIPASVSIRIPADAGSPYAVAEKQADGSLYNLNYSRQISGDWSMISFTTTSYEVHLEYYDPSLVIDGSARHFEYTWPGDYAIAQLTIQVQQPLEATDMRISPSLGSGAVGNDGLTYYTQDIGAISAGQTIQITTDYQKASNALSAENLPVEPSAPIPQNTVADLNLSAWVPWVLGIIGAGLIFGGIVWFWRSGRQRPVRPARRSRSRASGSTPQADATVDEAAVYCSQCGKRASPGDLFCRSCGAQLRSK